MRFSIVVLVLGVSLGATPLSAADAGSPEVPRAVMRYVYNGTQTPLHRGISYPWQLLKVALERTRAEFGDYELVQGPYMSESRRIDELRRATGVLNVMYYDASAELERELIPILIPVDKNIVGYRVFVVRRERLPAFTAAATVNDLKPFSFGLGFDWSDVGVVRNAGLRVVTGSDYWGLYDMVDNERFDVLLASASSVVDAMGVQSKRFPDLVIEPDVILYYPMPMYFWFPRTPEGERLAARAERGIRGMIEDGSFDQHFEEFYGPVIKQLNLTRRRIIRIQNPNLPASTPLGDARLWFDPARYEPLPRPASP